MEISVKRKGGTRIPGWFVEVTTNIGSLLLPLSEKGYSTKREAMRIAEQALNIPEHIKVEIVKFG